MLRLRKGKPPYTVVSLGGGAAIRVRAATQTDVEYAAAHGQRDIAGLAAGSEAVEVLEAVLGDGYRADALKTGDGLSVVAVRLCEIYLVLRCHDGWTGVATEDGKTIAEPDAATLALLLADPVQHSRIMPVVNAGIHAETAEGNASAALPSGEAATPTGAPTADDSASRAHAARLSRAKRAS